ncbi:MAG: molybdenum cofactor guanylyltransferase [Firmicutes bacterium]|nr:molybdenum cofactor guanylyltransferase [Bacillota bacterium]
MLSLDGVVLAGGASRRMGQPKADLLWAPGLTLLDHATAVLRRATRGTIWISREAGAPRLSAAILPDRYPNRGPLAGIETVFHHAASDLVLVLAVDLPLVPAEWYLTAYSTWQAEPALDVVYAVSEFGRPQPLVALWHRRTQPLLDARLQSPKPPRVMEVLASLRRKSLPLGEDALTNVNTPEEWQRLAQRTRL